MRSNMTALRFLKVFLAVCLALFTAAYSCDSGEFGDGGDSNDYWYENDQNEEEEREQRERELWFMLLLLAHVGHPDSCGTSPATASEIQPGETITAHGGGEWCYYKFTPSHTGTYEFVLAPVNGNVDLHLSFEYGGTDTDSPLMWEFRSCNPALEPDIITAESRAGATRYIGVYGQEEGGVFELRVAVSASS